MSHYWSLLGLVLPETTSLALISLLRSWLNQTRVKGKYETLLVFSANKTPVDPFEYSVKNIKENVIVNIAKSTAIQKKNSALYTDR